MAHTKILSVPIDSTLKQDVENVFKKLGLSTNQAINLFYRQVQSLQNLPFELEKIPNETTIKALQNAKAGEGVCFDTTDELFKELGIK